MRTGYHNGVKIRIKIALMYLVCYYVRSESTNNDKVLGLGGYDLYWYINW